MRDMQAEIIEQYVQIGKSTFEEVKEEMLRTTRRDRFIDKVTFREKYRVGNETIDNLVRSGKLQRTNFEGGRTYFYDVEEIENYLYSRKRYF